MSNIKLTDAEVIKALAQCENQTYCSDCPYYTKIGCKKHLYQDALDLINRQEEEKQNLEIELQAMRNAANGFKAEVEKLNEEIKKEQLYNLRMTAHSIKAEAYKECIEKVKEEMSIWSFDFSYYSDRTEAQKSLDNLWNEFERKENTIYDD